MSESNLQKPRTLIIASHPDDESLSCGGLIQKRVSEGYQVQILVLSGRVFDYGEQTVLDTFNDNVEALVKVMRILGGSTFSFHNLQEGEPQQLGYYRVLGIIEKYLREFDPVEVVIPSKHDLNQDHRFYNEVCRIALRAANLGNVQRVLETLAFDAELVTPNYYVPISEDMLDKKIRAVGVYESEKREHPHPRSVRSILAHHTLMGARSGTRYAEAYLVHLIRETLV